MRTKKNWKGCATGKKIKKKCKIEKKKKKYLTISKNLNIFSSIQSISPSLLTTSVAYVTSL